MMSFAIVGSAGTIKDRMALYRYTKGMSGLMLIAPVAPNMCFVELYGSWTSQTGSIHSYVINSLTGLKYHHLVKQGFQRVLHRSFP